MWNITLQVALTKLIYLPTGESTATKNELIIARDVLEIAVQFSVATKDIAAFERYISQLKCYYFDYKWGFLYPATSFMAHFHCCLFCRCRKEIGESKNKYLLLGLNLLYLLSQNRVSEFHTELELLPQEIIHTNDFIRHPLTLEQNLMEGRYNRIFRAKVSASHSQAISFISFSFITDHLLLSGSSSITKLQRFSWYFVGHGSWTNRCMSWEFIRSYFCEASTKSIQFQKWKRSDFIR